MFTLSRLPPNERRLPQTRKEPTHVLVAAVLLASGCNKEETTPVQESNAQQIQSDLRKTAEQVKADAQKVVEQTKEEAQKAAEQAKVDAEKAKKDLGNALKGLSK